MHIYTLLIDIAEWVTLQIDKKTAWAAQYTDNNEEYSRYYPNSIG